MKAKLLVLLFIGLALSNCSKNADSPIYDFKFISINKRDISPPGTLQFEFSVKHKNSGKIADTLFIMRKFRDCPFIDFDTLKYRVPSYSQASGNQQSTLYYSYQYGGGGKLNGCANPASGVTRSDSVTFYFWMKDATGNQTDTVKAPPVYLRQN